MSEWFDSLNVMHALMINDWCCEIMGDLPWDKDAILEMLENSDSEKEFQEKFKEWVILKKAEIIKAKRKL